MSQIQDTATQARYAIARRARDARFDGEFFIAVKTTGIYCRPICPATPPLERNVHYYATAISAAEAGFRPCLRCRPDSAPHSFAWLGTDTSFHRALGLINDGALQDGSVADLAARLGVSDRYLRQLFNEKLGTSPKRYAIYQQCLFAKKLLHETSLPIIDIAFAAGFHSVRRFNEAMQAELGLPPSKIRQPNSPRHAAVTLKVHYRPPYDWSALQHFLSLRAIDGLEVVSASEYGRSFELGEARGYFKVRPQIEKHCFDVDIHVNDTRQLNKVVQQVRAMLDADAPISVIDQHLITQLSDALSYQPGLRIPGIWSVFEAGVRAVLGQQVCVSAAHKLVTTLVHNLGAPAEFDGFSGQFYFPTPESVLKSDLAFLRMPGSRKTTLHALARYCIDADNPDDVDAWQSIKGIGPWTINYVKLRACRNPDIWLAGDAGLRNALASIDSSVDLDAARPWRSYLTFQLWHHLTN
ncbi:3-methyladenine DNA glycosylase [Arenicella chitinivorans]|uniref:DNA-3-methyladenine glycosylase II n=1 Tax=Arenicella chitinivorans TaxID=1329800 RepID=A0A918RHU0_9GAMM|nr:AlkA N-terminal domain-containing protein [Arenicella chitinivorans]GGZ98665.1 3-methyladenine DNA glycosylase [Arenicella chitinivorans]